MISDFNKLKFNKADYLVSNYTFPLPGFYKFASTASAVFSVTRQWRFHVSFKFNVYTGVLEFYIFAFYCKNIDSFHRFNPLFGYKIRTLGLMHDGFTAGEGTRPK